MHGEQRQFVIGCCATLLVGTSIFLTSPSAADQQPFTPTGSVSQSQDLLSYLIPWLSEDLADAHRAYPIYGPVKSVEISHSGMRKNLIYQYDSHGRITERRSTEESLLPRRDRPPSITWRVEFLSSQQADEHYIQEFCNDNFIGRHVLKFASNDLVANRYSYYPDGTLEPRPTATYSYDPLTRTFVKETVYLHREKICEPDWSFSDSTLDQTVFRFDSTGFVVEIVSGRDPTEPLYNHWVFTRDGNGFLEDTFVVPDKHLFRSMLHQADRAGNLTRFQTHWVSERFGTARFEPHDDPVDRTVSYRE